MKIQLYFKTPDVVYNTLHNNNIPEDEMETLYDIIGQWVKYGECITIEVDTEKKTAEVIN